MFSEADNKTNPWENIDIKKIPWILRWCTDFEYILGSQANLKMIQEARAVLVCIALYVPEKGISSSKLILDQAKGTLQTYLNPKRLEKINNGTLKPYPDLIMEDLDVLLHPEKFGLPNKKVIPLGKDVPYDENARDTIYVVFSIEGCHSISDTLDKDKMNPDELIENLNKLRAKIPLISINLTHLEQYPLCNHAYGIQFVSTEDFKPTGDRITNGGLKLIEHCYKNNILIDLKHMSLAARRMFIESLRKSKDLSKNLQPLICSHGAFTGISYSDIPDYINAQKVSGKKFSYLLWGKPKKYEMLDFFTSFNPSSINLYDEDILAIINSDGLIGLSLDKRILGYTDSTNRSPNLNELAFEEEYISNAEKDVYFTKRRLGKKMTDFHCITTQEVMQGGVVLPRIGFYHLCHFMQQVLHYMKVVIDNKYDFEKALTQLCIGSDFDGIIDPVWCCPNVGSLHDLKTQFKQSFNSFAGNNSAMVKLPRSFNVNRFAEQLFYENGRAFVQKRIQALYPPNK